MYPRNKLLRRFQFEEVKEDSVCSQLKKLKTSKAVRIDELPERLLKDSAGVVAKPLTTLINVSLFTGLVPSEWKSARVIPLFKGGKIEDMDNYRPISILPVVSKLLERVVHVQLSCFLHEMKLLTPFQCGFVKVIRLNLLLSLSPTLFAEIWTRGV